MTDPRQALLAYLQTAGLSTARANANLDNFETTIRDDEQKRFYHQPILRNCLYPGCLREFDINATMDGRPTEPNRSAQGWRQMRPSMATGYICPDHAPLVETHRPRWDEPDGTTVTLRCSCGWVSPAARWQGYATAAWQNHLIDTLEPQ